MIASIIAYVQHIYKVGRKANTTTKFHGFLLGLQEVTPFRKGVL